MVWRLTFIMHNLNKFQSELWINQDDSAYFESVWGWQLGNEGEWNKSACSLY